jgi:hypothetical protein
MNFLECTKKFPELPRRVRSLRLVCTGLMLAPGAVISAIIFRCYKKESIHPTRGNHVSKVNCLGLLGALLLAVTASPALAGKNDSKVIIVNKSKWAIHEMYFSPTKQTDWGDDQLGKQTINTGESFTLSGVPCDKWDVKVVDEDGDECVVENVGLCADADKWVINDSDLLACQAATE